MVDPAFYEGNWQPVMDRYSELQTMLGASGGGNVANIAKAILERLGLDQHPMDMKVSSLSGGERAKLALARQLVGLAGVDVIFLDEPTNHLDIGTPAGLQSAPPDRRRLPCCPTAAAPAAAVDDALLLLLPDLLLLAEMLSLIHI